MRHYMSCLLVLCLFLMGCADTLAQRRFDGAFYPDGRYEDRDRGLGPVIGRFHREESDVAFVGGAVRLRDVAFSRAQLHGIIAQEAKGHTATRVNVHETGYLQLSFLASFAAGLLVSGLLMQAMPSLGIWSLAAAPVVMLAWPVPTQVTVDGQLVPTLE